MTNTALQNSGVALPRGHELLWYEIDSVLGHGGFGITYLAHDKNLGRDVALKEYLPRSWAERQADFGVVPLDEDHREIYEKGLTRFMAEARTLARFKHPNIVQVLAVFEQHQTAYMAMEYEQGGSLSDLLRSRKFKVNQESLLRILLPICDGLQNVHDLGFLHRDIKPANIYLRDDGSPVLIDFGSSRETGILNTSDVTVLITQGYAPAEQYSKGFGEQGPWTDIYSLAASIYHTISGEVVVDALQRSSAVQSGLPDPFKPLSAMQLNGYTEAFTSAIDTALDVNPVDRPRSLSAWRQMLEASSDSGDATELRVAPPSVSTAENSATDAETALSVNQRSQEPVSTADDATTLVEKPPSLQPKSPADSSAQDNRTDTSTAAKSPLRFALPVVAVVAAIGAGAYFALSGNDADPGAVDTSARPTESKSAENQSAETKAGANNSSSIDTDASATTENATDNSTSIATDNVSQAKTDDATTSEQESAGAKEDGQSDNEDTNVAEVDAEAAETEADNDAVANAVAETNNAETIADKPVETAQTTQNPPSIVDHLPSPDSALELISPLDTITSEIEALTEVVETTAQDNADNTEASAALQQIGAKFALLADTALVKSSKVLSNAVAEGLVKSVGVNADNQAVVAGLVRSSSRINDDFLRELLASPSLTLEERETLVFGLASSSGSLRTSLQSDPDYINLIKGFKDSIVAEIRLQNFPLAARMTAIALSLQPDDKELKLLAAHLTGAG